MALLSVVIPTLNEAERIAQTVQRVLDISDGDVDLIVADGGSSDGTPQLAEPLARVLEAPRGRARQMNAGAAVARGTHLLFLHADTLLPANAFARIHSVLRDPNVAAGLFRLQFDTDRPLYRLYAAVTAIPWHRIAFGDRALFMRRTAFDRAGGFPDQPILEDIDLVRRLRQFGRIEFAPESVITSARRFERSGPLRQQLVNMALWGAHLAGVSPDRLAYFYRARSETASGPVPPGSETAAHAPDSDHSKASSQP
ncbi:MAG: TIGR04283 family arsenosugar biosynthesis glycosyltransferase [Bacteroidota bacterium]